MAYKKSNPNGQATMANSEPVVLASDHSDVKITLDSEAVVLGAGSAAIGKLAANSGVDIGDVDIASIAAGDNNIGNVDVLTINGVAPAFGTGLRGATVQRVTIATDDSVPVTNAGITTIAGAVSGTEMQVDVLTMPTVTVNAHAVTNAGTFVVQENGAALTALQLIDDTVATLGTTTYTEASTKGLVIGAVRRDADTTLVDTTNEVGPVQMNAAGQLKVEVFSGETLPVSMTSTTITGTVAVTQSGTWDEIGINDSGNSITVDNGGTFAVQSTLQAGTAYAGKLRLTDGTTDAEVVPLTGYNAQAVALVDADGAHITSIGGGTQYSDADANADPTGTVAMGTDGSNIFALHTDTSGDLQVDVLSSALPSGAATSAKQDTIIGHVDGIETLIGTTNTTLTTIDGRVDGIEALLGTIDADTGGILTATQLLDDAVYTDDADFTDGTSVGYGVMAVAEGTPSTVTDGDMGMLSMSTSRHLKVVATTSDALLTTIDADTGNISTKIDTIAGAVSGTEMQVDVLTMPTVTVTATNLDVQSGGADLATTTQAGAIQTAVELIDNAIYIDDADWTADTSSHALVGAVTQSTPSANTDGDTTPLITNSLRELRMAIPESDLATAATTHVKKYYTNAGAVTDGIIWSPAAGKRWFITSIFIQVSAAATVTLEDDLAGGDSPIWKAELTANQGWSSSFPVPWYSSEDAADLIITTTAGNVYVSCVGYEV